MSKWKQLNSGKVKQTLLPKKPQPETKLRLALDVKSRENAGCSQSLKFRGSPGEAAKPAVFSGDQGRLFIGKNLHRLDHGVPGEEMVCSVKISQGGIRK